MEKNKEIEEILNTSIEYAKEAIFYYNLIDKKLSFINFILFMNKAYLYLCQVLSIKYEIEITENKKNYKSLMQLLNVLKNNGRIEKATTKNIEMFIKMRNSYEHSPPEGELNKESNNRLKKKYFSYIYPYIENYCNLINRYFKINLKNDFENLIFPIRSSKIILENNNFTKKEKKILDEMDEYIKNIDNDVKNSNLFYIEISLKIGNKYEGLKSQELLKIILEEEIEYKYKNEYKKIDSFKIYNCLNFTLEHSEGNNFLNINTKHEKEDKSYKETIKPFIRYLIDNFSRLEILERYKNKNPFNWSEIKGWDISKYNF